MSIEPKQLKYYLETRLMLWHEKNNSKYPLVIANNTMSIRNGLRIDEYESEGYVPIMFPISALTEPVLEGGKIPIVELARMNSIDQEIGIIDVRNFGPVYGLVYFDSTGDKFEFLFSSTFCNFSLREYWKVKENEPCYQLNLINQLYKWHFWLFQQDLFKTGELIDKRTTL